MSDPILGAFFSYSGYSEGYCPIGVHQIKMVLLFPVHFVCHPHDYDDQHYEKDEQKYHIEHAPDLAVKNGELASRGRRHKGVPLCPPDAEHLAHLKGLGVAFFLPNIALAYM